MPGAYSSAAPSSGYAEGSNTWLLVDGGVATARLSRPREQVPAPARPGRPVEGHARRRSWHRPGGLVSRPWGRLARGHAWRGRRSFRRTRRGFRQAERPGRPRCGRIAGPEQHPDESRRRRVPRPVAPRRGSAAVVVGPSGCMPCRSHVSSPRSLSRSRTGGQPGGDKGEHCPGSCSRPVLVPEADARFARLILVTPRV
jgi:hypothetical protein